MNNKPYTKAFSEEDFFNGEHGPSMFHVESTPSSWEHKISVFGTLFDQRQLIRAIDIFEKAGPDDVITVHLSSPGGDIGTADTFISAMAETEAQVIVKATGQCASAATLILLAAPAFQLSNNFSALLHCGSVDNGGTLAEYRASSKFLTQHMERVLRESYEHFLTEDELDALIEGKDFWLDAEEFLERFNRRNKAMLALQAFDEHNQHMERLETDDF